MKPVEYGTSVMIKELPWRRLRRRAAVAKSCLLRSAVAACLLGGATRTLEAQGPGWKPADCRVMLYTNRT